ncbi:hypothetical protein B0H13DRAFT_2477102 [Mycena leptocephala]|nr:hypothetical protein B0H13DRAFT_2477102 [Mycena leptocephala]
MMCANLVGSYTTPSLNYKILLGLPHSMTDCPILVWMLALNREYTKEHVKIPYDPPNADSFRQVMTHMLPLLMMRHRRIPRAKWRDCVSPNGKHWIEQVHAGRHAARKVPALDDRVPPRVREVLCAMAMTQGVQRKVVNIGLGIKHVAVEPRGITLIVPELGDEVVLRRLCILLALKAAYIHAIGQPPGFDWGRLEFDIPNETARGDGHPLQGWEFRIFRASLGVARRDESTFVWHESAKDLESWVQFINIDQLVKVIPKLTA